MKEHATSPVNLPFSAMLLAACLACSICSGQENPTATAPSPKQPAGPKSTSYLLEIKNGVLLAGGKKEDPTLSRIVDVLRDLYPDVNIVLAPELGQVTVQDLKLRSAELPETLEALRVASGEAFKWGRGLARDTLIDPTTGLPVPSPAGSSSLYILSHNEALPPAPVGPGRLVQVFNLSGYLEHLGKRDEKEISASLEQIKKIISATLDQVTQGRVEAGGEPSFQFHPGANLFIVIGPPQAIEVTEKVINALPGVAGARGYPPQNPDARAMEAFQRRYGLRPQLPDAGSGSKTAPPPAAPPASR